LFFSIFSFYFLVSPKQHTIFPVISFSFYHFRRTNSAT